MSGFGLEGLSVANANQSYVSYEHGLIDTYHDDEQELLCFRGNSMCV